jgi:hypothetical protein
MASGQTCRDRRPDTWLHRPTLQREDFSCQPGAVHTWHLPDMRGRAVDVRCWGDCVAQLGRFRLRGFYEF